MALLHNPRHEKFSQLVASGVKPSEAYVSVGYKPTGAKQAASRLLTKVDVRERVSELQEAAARSTAEAVILNRQRVLHRLSELSHEAQQKGQYGAAARCEELIGREIGMFVQRDEPWDGNLDSLTDEQLEKLLAQFRAMLQASEQANGATMRQITAGETVIDISAENAGAADGNNWEQNAR